MPRSIPKKRQIRRLPDGLCKKCHQPNDNPYAAVCPVCINRLHTKAQERYKTRLAAGLCYRCGKERLTHRKCRWGQRCYLFRCVWALKQNSGGEVTADELLALYERQDGRCPYTGKRLYLGYNTTIDHIIPTSRGGSTTVENLQWVLESGPLDVNFMKGAMTHTEFMRAVKAIYQHLHRTA